MGQAMDHPNKVWALGSQEKCLLLRSFPSFLPPPIVSFLLLKHLTKGFFDSVDMEENNGSTSKVKDDK